MIKKTVFILITLLCVSQDTHAAGFFNKAARGLYHTTKWGLITAPFVTAGVGFAGYKYIEHKNPELHLALQSDLGFGFALDKNTLQNLIESSSDEEAAKLRNIHNYVREKASKQLGVPQENIIVKADSSRPTGYRTFKKNNNTYHIINLDLNNNDGLNLQESFSRYLENNESTPAPWIISHEIGHGLFQHGKYSKYLGLGSLITSYVAGCLLLKKGNALSINKNSSTFSILAKTVTATTLAPTTIAVAYHVKTKISRKNEWQADNYAINDLKDPDIFEATAVMFDKYHETMQNSGAMDPLHPEPKDRAQNLRIAAAKLRKEQAK